VDDPEKEWMMMGAAKRSILVLGLSFVAAPVAGQLTGTVVVANKGEATASFIDVATARIIGTAPTGPGPHELVVSSDGRTAVVTDYGGGSSTLTVLDVATARRVGTIDLPGHTRPHGIAFLPGDTLVAVTSEAAGAVIVVHLGAGTIVEALQTQAGGSHMLGATADGMTIWTGDMSSNTVTELSRRTGQKVRSFEAPAQPEAVNVTPDGARVFAGSNATGRVTAWSTSDGQATTVGEGFGWPYRVFLTPGVEQILIPDLRNEVLRFFDGDSYTELGRISFSNEGPQGLVLHPDGRHLFLSLSAAERIAIVDIEAREVLGYLPAGLGPDGIGYSAITR
jgi:DNA-binding beta-propeller fold protein YncE